MRYLIINADDFGMSQEVNEGIKRGIEAGVITSVSVMMNMPYSDDAITFLQKHPEVSVGLHFNITEGSPTLKPKQITTLIREDNSYFHWSSLLIKLVLRQCSMEEVNRALINQYRRLKSTGLKITHIDSHHHIHLFPSIFNGVVNFAHQEKVAALRSRRFNLWSLSNSIRKGVLPKQCLILSVCLFNNFFSKNSLDLSGVNSIYDLNWDTHLTEEKFLKIIRNLSAGVTEIICHPAVMSKDGNEKFLRPRKHGLDLLLSKSFLHELKKNQIQLISRHQLQYGQYAMK